MRQLLLGMLCALSAVSVVSAGPYSPAAGQPGSEAISIGDSSIVAWATSAPSLVRGPQDISNPGLGAASFGTAANALGAATGVATSVVSLGDGGSITLGFDLAIKNGAGFDFAIFENGFGDEFLELAFVEVSSDGTNFFRFNAVSLTQTATQVGGFDPIDPTNIDNLAGKYRAGFGTPFDLAELAGVSPLLDIGNVQFVRIVDAVGSINPAFATVDSLGNIVNEPWSTPFASSGFDLDGVGVVHVVPEASTMTMVGLVATALGVIRLRRRTSA